MAITLRLSRYGTKKKPFYRIVAQEKTRKRDGRFLEIVGTLNPMVEPPVVNLKTDKVEKWIGVGAEVSSVVRNIIRKKMPGYIEKIEERRLNKVRAARKARKERAKKTGSAKKK